MEFYGVNVSGVLNNYKENGLRELLRLAGDTDETTQKITKTFEALCDYIYLYDSSNGYCGLAGLICDAIKGQEGINVGCNGYNNDCVGIVFDTPWSFNKKTKSMTKEEFDVILSKYINLITDEALKIKDYEFAESD